MGPCLNIEEAKLEIFSADESAERIVEAIGTVFKTGNCADCRVGSVSTCKRRDVAPLPFRSSLSSVRICAVPPSPL